MKGRNTNGAGTKMLLRDHVWDLTCRGYSPARIAARLGKPVSTIYQHLYLARKERKPNLPHRTQTAVPLNGPREPGVYPGALPGGGDSPPVARPRSPGCAAAADPPSASALLVGKGAVRATPATPVPGTPEPGRGQASPASGSPADVGEVSIIESIVELDAWALIAAPGESRQYHRGELACSRSMIGVAAMRLAERGLVDLVQKRNGEGDYSYFAVRRQAPPAGLVAPACAKPERLRFGGGR